ncbi:cytochrome P450 26C1 [Paroedura picta]|uniref:cytochrome P450 26C1 n=1 Tax=Paroedura picta TaxID=143630 RepID=UPI001014FB23
MQPRRHPRRWIGPPAAANIYINVCAEENGSAALGARAGRRAPGRLPRQLEAGRTQGMDGEELGPARPAWPEPAACRLEGRRRSAEMLPPAEAGGEALSWLEAALAAGVALGLLLALARHLWALRWSWSRDRACALPLPQGSMGWPFFGETLHWLLQGSHFHSSRRQRYGPVFKTHLLGKPVIRVSGADHVRRILLSEHSLVGAQWPLSTQILLGSHTLLNASADTHRLRRKLLARVFSRAALESYLPRIQTLIGREVRRWCRAPGPLAVYSSAKTLTFRIAARVLLGLRLEEKRFAALARAFEQLVENLFSLPLNIPFSGLRKGIKARDLLHQYMEKAILEKLQRKDPHAESDALDFIIDSAKEYGKELTMQELKESAIELIFAAFFTTASASTSLILLLLKHPWAIQKIRQELTAHDLPRQCCCFATGRSPTSQPPCQKTVGGQEIQNKDSKAPHPARPEWKTGTDPRGEGRPSPSPHMDRLVQKTSGGGAAGSERREEAGRLFVRPERPECDCQPYLTLEKMSRLRYLDCVIKEVLRMLPPVSGGYRTALQTFELDGYQIPKGWSVMYSIRDTHETASIYQSPPDTFDPERFWVPQEEGEEPKAAGSARFHYIPFGGGVRNCIGKELAQAILKLLAMELVSTARWELATAHFPKMQTVPIVHPVDGLQLYFHPLKPGRERGEPNKAET